MYSRYTRIETTTICGDVHHAVTVLSTALLVAVVVHRMELEKDIKHRRLMNKLNLKQMPGTCPVFCFWN